MEIKPGDIVVLKTGNRAFEVIGKYIVPDDRLWRVDAITEHDPPTPDRNRKYRLVAVDCPNVILDEIPEIYVESCSEKLERELEEQRKEALKMNRNEIKQGDKVRVSKDAPKIYVREWAENRYCKVAEVEDDNAIITDGSYILAIPTKYLVKVDAEAKEAKYRKGDRVRHIKNDECGIVLNVEADGVYVGVAYSLQKRFWKNREIEPAQPKKQTHQRATIISEGDIHSLDETPTNNVGSITIPVEVDLTDSYWDAYAADIAKEVALKVANKFNDPKEAAEYAVSVAKAVVDGLKRERV